MNPNNSLVNSNGSINLSMDGPKSCLKQSKKFDINNNS